MQIRVLGCSGGVGPGLRTTSLLVNGRMLIDAGTGVGDLGLEEMARVTDIYLTHSHLDHCAGLAFMADNLFGEIDHPLRVHAIAETLTTLREHLFNWKMWPDFSQLPDAENGLLQWHEVTPGQVESIEGLALEGFGVLHTVPAIGYALREGDRCFAFSGDTYACEELWRALNGLPGLDRLMIEVAFADADDELARVSRHFTPALLGRELRHLNHRPKLLLTHHKPGHEAQIEAQCRTALSGWDYVHLKRGDLIEL